MPIASCASLVEPGVHAAAGDDAFDQIVSNPDGDVSHDLAEKNLLDPAWELVACRDCHSDCEL
jgi:hypothetical protein